MSYDVNIGPFEFDYTSNVSNLFHTHIKVGHERSGLQCLNGVTGENAGDILAAAFDSIHKEQMDYYSEMVVGEPMWCDLYDSDNGWGSAIGALTFLAQVMAACYQCPEEIVHVSW